MSPDLFGGKKYLEILHARMPRSPDGIQTLGKNANFSARHVVNPLLSASVGLPLGPWARMENLP